MANTNINNDHQKNNDGHPDLFDKAKHVLENNWTGLYTKPAKGLYPHQVLWDSCFVAIGKSHYDIQSAKNELLSLIRGQWKNGMAPNIIFNTEPQYQRDRKGWKSYLSPNAPNVATAGITQPPLMAEAILRVGSRLDDSERASFFDQMLPYLLAHHEWLYKERDINGDGLIAQVHPWETGLDTTPPWMTVLESSAMPAWIKFLKVTGLEKIGDFFRTDKKFAASKERSSNTEALALYNIQRHLRHKRYNIADILKNPDLLIADLTFNCILVKSNSALLEIAKFVKSDLPNSLLLSMRKTEASLNDLWDSTTEQFYSKDINRDKLISEASIATFMPLYAGIVSEEKAKKLVKLLVDQDSYSTKYPVPSVPINSKWFKPRKYWQGPSWVNMNWFIIQGLESYGFLEEAEKLRSSSIQMVQKSGFHEYFNPISGVGVGANNFSWTAALIIDLMR